jgi:hypothetical protein
LFAALDVPALIKSTQKLKYYETRGMHAGVRDAPLSERARKEIAQIETATIDYMPGVSSDEKKQRLSRMRYEAHEAIHNAHEFHVRRIHGYRGIATPSSTRRQCHHRASAGAQSRSSRRSLTPAQISHFDLLRRKRQHVDPESLLRTAPVQKDALHKSVKTPLVYSSVALRNWPALTRTSTSAAIKVPNRLET